MNVNCSVMSNSSRPLGLQPARLLYPWNSPGKNTGVGCHALLQGIFPTQVSNPGLPHCRQILYQLSHKGSVYKPYSIFVSGLLGFQSEYCLLLLLSRFSHVRLGVTP